MSMQEHAQQLPLTWICDLCGEEVSNDLHRCPNCGHCQSCD